MDSTNPTVQVRIGYRMATVLIAFILGAVLGCDSGGNDGSSPLAAPQINISYSTLREWSPGGGLGIEVVLEKDGLTEQDITGFVKQISSGHDAVVVKIYTSKAAWKQEQDNSFGPEYKSDYLVYFIRKGGTNEIRWMQEVGSFADKYGTKTQL